MKFSKFLISLIVTIILITPTTTYATQTLLSNQDLKALNFAGYEKINPNSLLYPIKRSIESILNSNSSSPLSKYNSRFSELVYIINHQKTGFLEETVTRYNSFLGSLKTLPKTSIPKEKITNSIKILETLRDKYPSNSPYRMLIQQSIDTTRGLI